MDKKTCKYCKERFEPVRPFQKHCLETTCIESNNEKTREKQRKDNRKALKQFNMNDVAVMKRTAQTFFNKSIRLRDKDLPCISCGHDFKGTKPRQAHAGHYRPQGGHSALRYHPDNCHVQCSICNNHLSGNLVSYREALIKKIGLTQVEEMETMDTMKRWTIEELNEVITASKLKIKLLEEVA